MYRTCRTVIIVNLLACVLATTSWADDPRAEKFYSDGVQAFYRGNYSRAIQAFDFATGHGSVDPRVYYFRGIAKCRQGRTDEARFDFEYGAQLEASQGRVDIGQSLQRVQGHDRLMLEQYRRQAQQMARLARPAATGVTAPPPATTRVEQPIPRKPVSEIPPRLRDLPNDPQDPFADEAPGLLGRGDLEQPAAALVPKPAAPQQAEVTDDAGQSDLGAADDPFAGPSAPAAADQTPPAQEDDDPFAGPSTPAAAPPPPAAADQTPPAQENEDPFVDDAAAAPAAGPAPRSPSAAKGGGALGAVFRAMTRSATDNPALKQGQSLLQNARGAMPGGAPAPGGRVVVPSEPLDQDPFFEGNPDENAAPAGKLQGTPLPEEDLFAEPGAAPAANGAAPPAPADEMDPAAADDPFADENP